MGVVLQNYNFIIIFLQFGNLKMNKDEVRKNREKLRQKIITCLVVNTQERDRSKDLNSHKMFTPQIALMRKRKTSEDIRIMDDLTYLKQVYLEKQFQNLYELQEKIGEGSHTSIYKCKELDTGNIYAAKIFKTVELQNIRHVKQHYRIKKSLSHQNIIKGYYLYINEKLKKIHMICEYCPYKDLRYYMTKNKKIKQENIAAILYSIINGIAYLHKNGVCHRDIKPENILYNQKTGQLKIIDFQLAKMCKYTNQRLQMWTSTGTLHYKAPEMFKGSYNESIDMWAVGIIAFQMAFQKYPFANEYLNQTIKSICENQPIYQSNQISPSLLHFLKRCLTKNPLKRITAVQALQTPFLLKFQQGSPCSSPKNKRKSYLSGSNTDEEDDKNDKHLNFEDIKNKTLKAITYYNQQKLMNQTKTFSEDIGIRFIQN